MQYVPCDRYSNALKGCSKLGYVCLPNTSRTFCGKGFVWTNDQCEIFRSQENECYHVVVTNTSTREWSLKMRYNAEQWVKRESGCMDFVCDNTSGLAILTSCVSSNKEKQYCWNNRECSTKEFLGKRYVVKISIEDSDEVPTDAPLKILDSIGDLTSYATYTWMISTEMNEKHHYVSVRVYVDYKITADAIADRIKTMNKGSSCSYGVLCYSTKAEVTVDPDAPVLTSGASALNNLHLFAFILMLMFNRIL